MSCETPTLTVSSLRPGSWAESGKRLLSWIQSGVETGGACRWCHGAGRARRQYWCERFFGLKPQGMLFVRPLPCSGVNYIIFCCCCKTCKNTSRDLVKHNETTAAAPSGSFCTAVPFRFRHSQGLWCKKESGWIALNGGRHLCLATGSAYVDEWHFFRQRKEWVTGA